MGMKEYMKKENINFMQGNILKGRTSERQRVGKKEFYNLKRMREGKDMVGKAMRIKEYMDKKKQQKTDMGKI